MWDRLNSTKYRISIFVTAMTSQAINLQITIGVLQRKLKVFTDTCRYRFQLLHNFQIILPFRDIVRSGLTASFWQLSEVDALKYWTEPFRKYCLNPKIWHFSKWTSNLSFFFLLRNLMFISTKNWAEFWSNPSCCSLNLRTKSIRFL